MITIQNLGRAAAIAAATLVIAAPVTAFAAPIPAKPAPEAVDIVRYCVTDQIGGSRFTKRTCKTRDAWIQDESFDPVAFMRTRK